MKTTLLLLIPVLTLVFSSGVYARDCETELGETMDALKKRMRVIKRIARSDDSQQALAVEIDEAVALVQKAKDQQPLIYGELSGDRLQAAKDFYSEGLTELNKQLLELKDADFDEVDDMLDAIKSRQKKAHKKLKDC